MEGRHLELLLRKMKKRVEELQAAQGLPPPT